MGVLSTITASNNKINVGRKKISEKYVMRTKISPKKYARKKYAGDLVNLPEIGVLVRNPVNVAEMLV